MKEVSKGFQLGKTDIFCTSEIAHCLLTLFEQKTY